MTVKTINISRLKAELKQFTGTEDWYKNPLFPKFLYTDGVKYLAEQAGAYWLIDYVFSNQSDPKIKQEPFQVWKISVMESNEAFIVVEDGNNKIIKRFHIEYTDFPAELCGEKGFSLWFTDRVLLLPSEY